MALLLMSFYIAANKEYLIKRHINLMHKFSIPLAILSEILI